MKVLNVMKKILLWSRFILTLPILVEFSRETDIGWREREKECKKVAHVIMSDDKSKIGKASQKAEDPGKSRCCRLVSKGHLDIDFPLLGGSHAFC